MEKVNTRSPSYLFTVRVWEQEVDSGQIEWWGRVQLMTTGETRYFRSWGALFTFLPAMLAEATKDTSRG
jgi:hypothetical protein